MRSSNSPIVVLRLVAALCLFAVIPCFGQTTSVAALRVTVTDANQRPVRDAVCSLLGAATDRQPVATATTDEQGVALFSTVSPGPYTLRVEREGFDSFGAGVVVRQ